MANPRKFSEKIAQHKQKQAEETAAFERIMREVSDATNKGVTRKPPPPPPPAPPPPQEQSSLRPAVALGTFRSGSLPNVAREEQCAAAAAVEPEEMSLATQYAGGGCGGAGGGGGGGAGAAARAGVQRGRAASSVGPMRARPAERKHDTSPYGSSVYLSPPPDSSWRRTSSDSALHQSCGGGGGGDPAPAPASLSPHHYTQHQHHHRRTAESNHMLAMMGATQPRPRSSCEAPRVPGINVYESGGGGGGGGGMGTLGTGEGQVPGGSLPDLTSLHYPESVGVYPPAPHRTPSHYHSRDLYRQSPTSPGTMSPAGGGGGGGGALHSDHQHPAYDAQNHLSVPNSNSYLHHNNQSMSPLEQSWISAGYQAHCSPPSLHSSHSNINIPSPTMGVHSPGSPAAESPQPDSFYISQALLQPFQQISMMDTPVTSYSTSYMNHSSTPSPQATDTHHIYTTSGERGCGGGERDARAERDPVAGGNGPLFPPVSAASHAPGIPDIIFTDFSGELGSGKDLDGGLFGCEEEERLRDGLDPVDLDGLTLLADPGSLLSDPAAEDVFRLDRL